MNVTVKGELSLILQGSDSTGIPETSYLRVALCRNWEKRNISTLCGRIPRHMLPKVLPNGTDQLWMSQCISDRRILSHRGASVWTWWPPPGGLGSQTWSSSSAETLCFQCSFLWNVAEQMSPCQMCIERPGLHFWRIVWLACSSVPETARRVVESTGMAHCAIPKTKSSLQASSKRISYKKKGFSWQHCH